MREVVVQSLSQVEPVLCGCHFREVREDDGDKGNRAQINREGDSLASVVERGDAAVRG
jgi:hypothetical protein